MKSNKIVQALGRRPKKIAILRALNIGDLLCTVPAWRALRHAFPRAHITLIGLPWSRSFVRRFSRYLDAFVEFPGYPGLPEQAVDPRRTVNFIRRMQGQAFDVLLQMQGNGTFVNSLAVLLAPKVIAGYYLESDFNPNPALCLPYPDAGSEVQRHLALMDFLGLELQGADLEFPLTRADFRELAQLNVEPADSPYVCIHPGARGLNRRWPPKFFARLAERCAAAGYRVYLTGTADERELTADIVRRSRAETIDLAGQTSLGGVAALIGQASLLICNDTGVSHIAAALRTPSFIISTNSDIARWSPLNHKLHRTLVWDRASRLDDVERELSQVLRSLPRASRPPAPQASPAAPIPL